MFRYILLAIASGSVTLLAACDRSSVDIPPIPVVRSPASAADTSVPPAASVLDPATPAVTAGSAPSRGKAAMSRADESAAMPMPRQANDHSAPLPPAR